MEVPPGKLKPVKGKWYISTNLCRAGACVFRVIFQISSYVFGLYSQILYA